MSLSVSCVISEYQYGIYYYTCITSVTEYSKSIRQLHKWFKVLYYGHLHYFSDPCYVCYLQNSIRTLKLMSQTSPVCTYLHAGTGLCTSVNNVYLYKVYSFNKCLEL